MAGVIDVPVNKPVKVYLMSRDVLHSFFLPHMRMKRDAVPGLRGVIYFTPTRTGKFELACAELCGWGHYKMRGRIKVESREDFNAWLAKASAEEHATQAAQAAKQAK